MRRLTVIAAIVVVCLAALGLSIGGTKSMSLFSHAEPLLWEGAAGRTPASFVPIAVQEVKPYKGGLFGVGQSPSIEGSFPNAHVIAGERLDDGKAIAVRLPGASVPAGAVQGARLVLGLVDSGHVICLLTPPGDVAADGLADWAKRQPCG